MMMHEEPSSNSIAEISNGAPSSFDVHGTDYLVGRLSDLSLKSFNHQIPRRRSAKFSYDSDASFGSEMSVKSSSNATTISQKRRGSRRFSHTGSLSGNSIGRASPFGRRFSRRMSEMSLGEYSSTIDGDDKTVAPPQTIYTIQEDSENDTNSVTNETEYTIQENFTSSFNSSLINQQRYSNEVSAELLP